MKPTDYDLRRQAMRAASQAAASGTPLTCPAAMADDTLCGKPANWLINAEPICWAHAQEIYLRQRSTYDIDAQRRLASQITPNDVWSTK